MKNYAKKTAETFRTHNGGVLNLASEIWTETDTKISDVEGTELCDDKGQAHSFFRSSDVEATLNTASEA